MVLSFKIIKFFSIFVVPLVESSWQYLGKIFNIIWVMR